MERKNYWMLIIFTIFLILFAIFSTRIGFHDVYEYITISKNFAGIKNVNIFSGHSLLYPLIISIFLKIWPSLTIIKLVNVSWLFGIGALLLFWLKNKKVFIIFAFSPLIWFVSIQTTPVLPATFFFFLFYIFIKKESIKYNLLYAGFFLGISIAVYTPMALIGSIFILIYFFDKSFKEFFFLLIAVLVGSLPRFVLDYYLFKMPVYSFIRYAGANFIVSLGLNLAIKDFNIIGNLEILLIFVLISPFLFKIYRLKFKFYKKEVIFIILASIIFLMRGTMIKYFLIISPIILFLLSKVLTKKEIKWHIIFSIILIIIMTGNYFTTNEIILRKDLEEIKENYNVDYIIAQPAGANKLATFSWQNKPYFVWFQDFNASLKNETFIRGYEFDFDSKIPLKSRLKISASFNRFEDKVYENYILVTEKDIGFQPENFNLKKCYEILCVYEK